VLAKRKIMKTLEEKLEHQIELVEADDSYTQEEKRDIIKELYREARDYEQEQRQRAYDEWEG
jgi:hypothetical protein